MELQKEIEDCIKANFPGATDISTNDDGTAFWMVGEREYMLTGWRIGASEGPEDWGTHATTFQEVIENAAEGDWSDHGFFLAQKKEN